MTHLHAEWIVASKLSSLKPANKSDLVALAALTKNTQIADYFKDRNDILVHQGDLEIDGDFDCDAILLVRGNLIVTGNFDDYRSGTGILAVQGAMSAGNLYSWGSLFVGKDLNVRGLAMAVYNDFIFEVAGKVNARALVVSDKSSTYQAGKIQIKLVDGGSAADQLRAQRNFVPEVFTQPNHFEAELDQDYYGLSFDTETARGLIDSGQAIFRSTPANANIDQQVRQALQSATSQPELQAFIQADLLLAQLIASRPDLADSTVQRLLSRKDPVVNAWLATSRPEMVYVSTGGKMDIALATALAKNPATEMATLRL